MRPLPSAMQRSPLRKQPRLPYSKWSQHRADNGLIYLAHPVTGEVKWLWSRHHDPKTDHDYLVNTITGQRQWVTKENEHFCPVKAAPNSKIASDSKTKTNPEMTTTSLADTPQPQSALDARRRPSGAHSAVQMPAVPAKVALQSKQDEPGTKLKYRELEAPKSLGLTADEKLMLVPETGRRYIYNNKTKTSRWLPAHGIDTIAAEKKPNSFFGRSKASRQNPSILNNNSDDIDPEVKRKTQIPLAFPAADTAIPNASGQALNPAAVRQDGRRFASPAPRQNAQAFRHANGFVNASKTSKGGSGNGERNEVNEVAQRLASLNTILADVARMTTSDKYDMSKLRAVAKERSSKEQVQEGAQRLLELEEYLTQQMLKVDGVESAGNQTIRAKRKETVKAILALTEEIERLRRDLSS